MRGHFYIVFCKVFYKIKSSKFAFDNLKDMYETLFMFCAKYLRLIFGAQNILPDRQFFDYYKMWNLARMRSALSCARFNYKRSITRATLTLLFKVYIMSLRMRNRNCYKINNYKFQRIRITTARDRIKN